MAEYKEDNHRQSRRHLAQRLQTRVNSHTISPTVYEGVCTDDFKTP